MYLIVYQYPTYNKKNPQLKKNPEQLKIKKEHISLGQKRFLRDRIIKEKYGFTHNDIRAYIHYHPSFWHLHIHFNLVKNQ